jgi:hypothetical protein
MLKSVVTSAVCKVLSMLDVMVTTLNKIRLGACAAHSVCMYVYKDTRAHAHI